MDVFFAHDIPRLFAFRDVDPLTAPGISRPTVERHLRAPQITHAVTLVRPDHGGRRREPVKLPRVHGFDPGGLRVGR